MAEAAAGAIIAEQIISTGVEAGAAAAIARPTQPLKGTLKQIKVSDPGDKPTALLARSHHTLTSIDGTSFIFGGKGADGCICPPDILGITLPTDDNDDATYSAFPGTVADGYSKDSPLPSPRYGHAACARGKYILVHGGRNDEGATEDGRTCIWLWDSGTACWDRVHPSGLSGKSPEPRFDHTIFFDEKHDAMVLHGGKSTNDALALLETWVFDFRTTQWVELPQAPTEPTKAVKVDDTLYSIGTTSDAGATISSLSLKDFRDPNANLEWSTTRISSDVPNPAAEAQGGSPLVPLTTGLGRFYVLQFFSSRQGGAQSSNRHVPLHSDIWSLQVPAKTLSSSGIKDAIRERLPKTTSGVFNWCETELLPVEPTNSEGKAHPGPRHFYGADSTHGGRSAILWGGVNIKGETESDGWIIQFQ